MIAVGIRSARKNSTRRDLLIDENFGKVVVITL